MLRAGILSKNMQLSQRELSLPFAIEGAYNEFELKRLKQLLKIGDLEETPALTHGDANFGQRGEDSERIAYETPIPHIREFDWFYQKLEDLVWNANESVYGFDLHGFLETSIYLRYDSNEKGKYDFHMDVGGAAPSCFRKLSCTILVNDDYEGGELIFNGVGKNHDGTDIIHYPKTAGTIIFFPSYLMHAVKPVTKGTRYSIVTWIHGPCFK